MRELGATTGLCWEGHTVKNGELPPAHGSGGGVSAGTR